MRAGALSNRTIRLFAYLRRPVKPRVREGQGRGVQWRHGLGQDACQGRDRIAVQPEGTTRLPVSGKGPGEGRPCGSRIAVSSPRQGKGRAGAYNGGAGWGKMRVRAGARLPYSRKAPRGCPYPGRGWGRGDLVKAGSPFRARVREGRGRGVQWRCGLGQYAYQGRHSLLSESHISTI